MEAAVRDGTADQCRDTGTHCEDWASKGECKGNRAFMTKHCRKACGGCPDGEDPENRWGVQTRGLRTAALSCPWQVR